MFENDFEITSGFLSTKSINITKELKEFENYIKRSVLQAPFLFKYNGFFIDVNEIKNENVDDILRLYLASIEILKKYEIFPLGIKNCKKSSKEFFQKNGILVFIENNPTASKNIEIPNVGCSSKPVEKIIEKEKIVIKDWTRPMIHYGVVRGGQTIFAEDRDLIIFGHVKMNAEVGAGRNLIIMGHAEGRLAAGLSNDSESVIIVGKYNPSLVSINGNFNTIDSDDKNIGKTIKIQLDNDSFKFEEISI
jgi:septum site-determining protein MinC